MDIDRWLGGIGLAQYGENFRANDIDVSLLSRLQNDDLKDIGIASLGHRKKILEAIAAISGSSIPAPRDDAERRNLAVLFCDLVGSTQLSAKMDAEDWRDLVGGYLDAASAAVLKLGGQVAKKLGDGIMAVFGLPVAQENDCERAVRAALAIQLALVDLNKRNRDRGLPELVVRIGIETGKVVVDQAGELFGDAPNVAARVQAEAAPGSVLVTGNVFRQVAGLFITEDRGAQALKGIAQPVPLYRIVRASGAGRRSENRAPSAFIGRTSEISTLLGLWDRASGGESQFVTIVGEPGLGKSRLVDELHFRLVGTRHTWVEWSASQLLQNTPLHPVAEWGQLRFGGADVAGERRLAELELALAQVGLAPEDYAPLLAPLVNVPLPAERLPSQSSKELRERQMTALIEWLTAGARVQPIVFVLEDLHWMDPTTLDVLRRLVENHAKVPVLVVATTRPEFVAPWEKRDFHQTIALGPLDAAQIRSMVGKLASGRALSADVIAGVGERTGGVPLFVEEVTRLILESDENYDALAIPPTLNQSLSARLDRLGSARDVAMVGSVLGRDFSYALLAPVAGLDDAELREALAKLTKADVLLAEGQPPDAIYRFKHALIQDAAREHLLKSRRQTLHRRTAETLLKTFPDRAARQPEVLAHHFTQAGLTSSAIEYWSLAGDQALRRSAFKEAISHLGKAIEMADKAEGSEPSSPQADSRRLKLQADYGSAVAWSRGFGASETQAAFARARELASASADPSGRAATLYGVWVGHLVRSEMDVAREAAENFLNQMMPAGPSALLATAHRVLGFTASLQGDFGPARTHLEAAIEMSNPEREREGRALFGQDTSIVARSYLAHVLWSTGDQAGARALIAEAVDCAEASAHVPTQVNTIDMAAILEMARGDFDRARPLAQRMGQIAAGPGLVMYASTATMIEAWASVTFDGPAAAARNMRAAIEEYTRPGSKILLGFYTGRLAELEAMAGDLAGALETVELALDLSRKAGDRREEAVLHRIHGDILLKRAPRSPASAERAYHEGIALARLQGARTCHAMLAQRLARLYESANRLDEAQAILAAASDGFPVALDRSERAEMFDPF